MSNTPRTNEVFSRLNGLPDKDRATYMFFHARELEIELNELKIHLENLGLVTKD